MCVYGWGGGVSSFLSMERERALQGIILTLIPKGDGEEDTLLGYEVGVNPSYKVNYQ